MSDDRWMVDMTSGVQWTHFDCALWELQQTRMNIGIYALMNNKESAEVLNFIIELVDHIRDLETSVIDLQDQLANYDGYETVESQHFRRYTNEREERIAKRIIAEPRVLANGFDEGWIE